MNSRLPVRQTGTLTTELHPQIKKYLIFKVLINLHTASAVLYFVARFVLLKYYALRLKNVKGFPKRFLRFLFELLFLLSLFPLIGSSFL